jgi:LuxR family transcriptional regulator, maltose regulon positive regulatory protein
MTGMSLDLSVSSAPGDFPEATAAAQAAVTPLVPPPASHARPPRTTCGVVERQHLRRRLARCVDEAPLTLICAPAGSGKTVLAADWASSRSYGGRPVAWLTVTERDNHAAVFWIHLRLALATVGALTEETAVRPILPDAADIDALSANLLELTSPVALVVDGVERLRTQTVHEQLARLIDAAGESLRLVMTSRVEPPLPVHRYFVEGRLAEIRTDELALGRGEIEQLLVRHGLPRSRALSEEVLRRTEGWAAGVRLAALQLATNGAHVELDGFATSYLRAEVIADLTPLEREVLTATSILEDLPSGLAPLLVDRPDADDLIRTMSSGNSFVLPVRGRPGVFRVHPLVRDLLRADLDQRAPGRATALHLRAAEWFDEKGELEPAVHHAAAACDWEAAAGRVLERGGLAEVLAGTTTGLAIAEDLAAIPERGSPDATLVRAAIALRDGDLDGARVALGPEDVQERDGSRGVEESLLRAAWHHAADQPAEALEAARRAKARLDEIDTPDPLTRAAVATLEGDAQLRTGDLDAAREALREAVSASADADGPLRLRCLAELALAEACQGELTRALELVDAADRSGTDLGVPATARPVAVELARAWVAVERQDLRQAQRSLDRLNRNRGVPDDETWRTITSLLRIRFLHDRGDVTGARRQLENTEAAESPAGWLRSHLDAELRAVGAPGGSSTSPARMPDRRLRELLDKADRRCRAGDVAGAKLDVERALQQGRAEKLRRPFAHASSQVWALIRSDARLRAKAGWLRPEQPGGSTTAAAPVAQPVLEALSDRELQVLRHLAAFLTTEEIGAEMFISVNTVRTHVRRVLEKLSVSRRNDAVRRGKQLGLV